MKVRVRCASNVASLLTSLILVPSLPTCFLNFPKSYHLAWTMHRLMVPRLSVSLVMWQLTYNKQKAETVKTFKGYAPNWHNVILLILILLLKAVTVSVHTEGGKETDSISWCGHNTEEYVGWKILLWLSMNNTVCTIQPNFHKCPSCPRHQASFSLFKVMIKSLNKLILAAESHTTSILKVFFTGTAAKLLHDIYILKKQLYLQLGFYPYKVSPNWSQPFILTSKCNSEFCYLLLWFSSSKKHTFYILYKYSFVDSTHIYRVPS